MLAKVGEHQNQVRRNLSLEQQVAALNSLLSTFSGLDGEQPLEKTLESIVQGMQMTTAFPVVLFSVYDSKRGLLQGAGGAGLNESSLAVVRDAAFPWDTVQAFLKSEFKVSESFWIPEKALSAERPAFLGGGLPDIAAANGRSNQALLLLPLYSLDRQPLGLITLVGHGRDEPEVPVIEALENLAAPGSCEPRKPSARPRAAAPGENA